MLSRRPVQAAAKTHAHRAHEDALRRLSAKGRGYCLRPLRRPVRGGPNASRHKKTLARETPTDALRPVPYKRVRRSQRPGTGRDLRKHRVQRHRRLVARRVKQPQRSHWQMCNVQRHRIPLQCVPRAHDAQQTEGRRQEKRDPQTHKMQAVRRSGQNEVRAVPEAKTGATLSSNRHHHAHDLPTNRPDVPGVSDAPLPHPTLITMHVHAESLFSDPLET